MTRDPDSRLADLGAAVDTYRPARQQMLALGLGVPRSVRDVEPRVTHPM